MELIELTELEQIESVELRARAENLFPVREIDRLYLVRRKDEEVAFLAYVLFPGDPYLVIYELFVAKQFRWQGIGSELICQAEGLARKLGYGKLLVQPKPLSDDISQTDLIKWYEKQGFEPEGSERGLYVKLV